MSLDPRILRNARDIMRDLGTLPPDKVDEKPKGPNEAEVKSDKALIADLQDRWNMADRSQREMDRAWKESIAFLEGMQWVVSGQNFLLNVQGVQPKGKERVTDNRVLDHARRLHARLDRPAYEPYVLATSDDPVDHEGAKSAQALLKNFYQRRNVAREKRLLMWWVVACGIAYLEPYFDPDAGNWVPIPKLDEDGQPVWEPALDDQGNPVLEAREIPDPATGQMTVQQVPKMQPAMELQPEGEVDFVVRSPFHVRRDPRAQEWRKLRWMFVEETAAREEVLDRYGDAYRERTDQNLKDIVGEGDKIQTVPYVPEVAVQTADYTGIPRPVPGVTGVVRLKRYYERPSRKHPKGRHVVYTGTTVLHRGDLDTPDGDVPLIPLGYLMRPWLAEGRSPVGDCKQLQRLYNSVLSRWADHIRRWAAGYLLVSTVSGIPRRSFTSDTGVIRYNPAGGVPTFVFPPFGSLTAYERILAKIEGSMEERMALPPVMRGQVPRGAKAARMVELLKESADEIQAPVIDDIADAFRQFWVKVLALAHKHYTMERMIFIVGDDKKASVAKFKGGDHGTFPADWRDRLMVGVESQTGLPASRMARTELILALARQHGMFGQPGTPDYARKLRNALDLDAGMVEMDSDLDVSIAEQENVLLGGGRPILVRPIDDDRAHLVSHVTYAKRLVAAGKERQAAIFLPHIDAHRQAMAAKLGAMPQQRQQQEAHRASVPGREPQPAQQPPPGPVPQGPMPRPATPPPTPQPSPGGTPGPQ